MEQFIDVIKTNIPMLIMTLGNKKTKLYDMIYTIILIPIIIIIIKFIIDNLYYVLDYIFKFIKNIINKNKKFITVKYYKKMEIMFKKNDIFHNKLYNKMAEYLADLYLNQITEFYIDDSYTKHKEYILNRQYENICSYRKIPFNIPLKFKIEKYNYKIIHLVLINEKIEIIDGQLNKIKEANEYFEVITENIEGINLLEQKINEYHALKCPPISKFILYKYNNVVEKIENNKINILNSIAIKTYKSWDNIFLTKENEKIIKDEVLKFINAKEQYKRDGIPWKLGYLFYGKPGCGKTSLIYTIGWMTKRNIYSIDLSKIKTNDEFNELVSKLNNFKKSIIVFDDVDVHEIMHCRKLLKEKEKEKINLNEHNNLLNTIMDKLSNNNMNNNNNNNIKNNNNNNSNYNNNNNSNYNNDNNKLTLDTILSYLDGYSSLYGCIIIMTSNRPEILDPAIIRPGRIDHKIKFGYCNLYQFKNIFKFYTGKDIPEDYIFDENKYTTSYIINTIIIPNRNNYKVILDLLKNDNYEENFIY